MKFEANIPSYLRTGHGVFPVKKKDTPKFREVSGNFYERAKKGFDIPITSETKPIAFAPIDDSIDKPVQTQGNFLANMQANMAKGPVKPIPGQQPLPLPDPMDDELPKLNRFAV